MHYLNLPLTIKLVAHDPICPPPPSNLSPTLIFSTTQRTSLRKLKYSLFTHTLVYRASAHIHSRSILTLERLRCCFIQFKRNTDAFFLLLEIIEQKNVTFIHLYKPIGTECHLALKMLGKLLFNNSVNSVNAALIPC